MEKKREKRTSRKGDRIVSVCMVLVFFVYLFLGIQVNADAGEQKTVKIGYYEAHDFQEGADDSAAKVDIVTNIFRRLLHIQGGVTNMYMGNGKIFMKS